jgi:hypothetical protein
VSSGPRTARDKHAINRFLQVRGFGRLEDGAGLVEQLAFLVQGHDHLRELLIACEPELRRNMYEALRAHLRFPAHPLDTYISQAAAIAERKQLPLQNADGTLSPFKREDVDAGEPAPPEIAAIQRAVEQAVATGFITVTCRKCTKQESFPGATKADAVDKLRNAGWTWGLDRDGKGREICPSCPGGSEKLLNS